MRSIRKKTSRAAVDQVKYSQGESALGAGCVFRRLHTFGRIGLEVGTSETPMAPHSSRPSRPSGGIGIDSGGLGDVGGGGGGAASRASLKGGSRARLGARTCPFLLYGMF